MSMADPSSPTALKGATTSAEDQEDAFLQFVEYARSMLSSNFDEDTDAGGCDGGDASAPPWSWVVSRILKSCVTYSSGVTPAILLSDLFQAWIEQRRYMTSKKKLEWKIPLEKRHKRMKLPHTVTIDSIYEKNFLSPSSVIEAVVIDTFLLPGTNIYLLSLGDMWSSCTIDLYLHRRYYDLVEFQILKKGREIFLTGCCLRSAMDGSGHPRLLPTEYLIVLLDEDQDEDALLLGAQFCSDSFSSISVDAFKNDISYSFYARQVILNSIENFRGVETKGVTLVDSEGVKIRFVLWGDQVLLANKIFSPGSMLALDKPFIAHIDDANITSQELCLEFGSATRIYMVPFTQQEEQVLISSTQLRSPGPKLSSTLCQNQGLNVSQVMLPLDSQGSVDFKNYPLQLLVAELRDKMTGVSIYGVVRYINREVNSLETIFRVKLEDTTGAIVAKLHFVRSWSLGHLGIGHSVFISALTCSLNADKKLEVSWFEKDVGNTLVNLSCLPALLNSSCLHKSSCIADISKLTETKTHICHTSVVSIEHHDVCLIKSHASCGYPVSESSDGSLICSFCHLECDGEILDNFQLKVTLGDETGRLCVWCTCQTATELLQITPDEYIQLPVVEQAMYLCTLTGERLIVAVVNCRRDTNGSSVDLHGDVIFEVVRAQKW
ncbi:hypothetical protein ZIOFF_023280 [Zingiber officinale]|uniref:Nucleic acid-binding protein n=1 Tax=Zingiber officinale TaxID=94328 RepID=A0A8J5HGG8_ZINOF|nr:hypothetical protein ZIOFF_023280 [Zingiber officinale]